MGICDPKGRDCIERNSLRTFDCNTTCVGIYADIQFVKKDMKDKLTVEITKDAVETEFNEKFEEGSNMLLKRLIHLEEFLYTYGYDALDLEFREEFDKGSSILLKRLLDLETEVKLLKMGVPQQIGDELLKRGVGENGRELDKEKYNVLIAEYMRFKAKYVKHFRFNSAGNSSAFGETF